MGSYGIGVGRLMGCIAEEHHDERGLIWPVAIAPFPVGLMGLGCEEDAERTYRMLADAGVEIFYDDRNERAGVKFADADLMGFPLRLTVSDRSVREGGAEMKLRTKPDKRILPWEGLVAGVKREIDALTAGGSPSGDDSRHA
jgi:prolyl-tRNA synthetase